MHKFEFIYGFSLIHTESKVYIQAQIYLVEFSKLHLNQTFWVSINEL